MFPCHSHGRAPEAEVLRARLSMAAEGTHRVWRLNKMQVGARHVLRFLCKVEELVGWTLVGEQAAQDPDPRSGALVACSLGSVEAEVVIAFAHRVHQAFPGVLGAWGCP
eukprot:1622064-Heterocapsa_arctica.AAC.1